MEKQLFDEFKKNFGLKVNIKSHQHLVGEIVRGKLFAKVKFINNESQLEYNGKQLFYVPNVIIAQLPLLNQTGFCLL